MFNRIENREFWFLWAVFSLEIDLAFEQAIQIWGH